MDKRLAKRHKRQVARARASGKLTEPDLRTPEQIKADREAGRVTGSLHKDSNAGNAVQSFRGSGRAAGTGSAAKTAV